MKHLLNNLSEEEKNRIREQHEGGMNVAIDNFKTLVETKSGEAKPFINDELQEQMNLDNPQIKDGGRKLGQLKDDEIKKLASKIVDCLDDESKKLLFKLNFEPKNHRAFFDMVMIEMDEYINSFGPKGPLG